MLAAQMFGIPVKGTHAHSFIMSYSNIDDLKVKHLKSRLTQKNENFVELCYKYKEEVCTLLKVLSSETNHSELVCFVIV